MTWLSYLTPRFPGAPGTVTGSLELIRRGKRGTLIDCGLFQGFKWLRRRNRKPLPFRPGSIKTVLLKHTRFDLSGYLPALIRAAIRGPAFCATATRDSSGMILHDSGHLKEEEAKYAPRKRYSEHKKPLTHYALKYTQVVLNHFETAEFEQPVDLGGGPQAEFIPAGHPLGAAQSRLKTDNHTVHFSGDPGHASETALARALKRVFGRGGIARIPATAVDGAQEILHHITSFGGDRRNAILQLDFRAGGTGGAELALGERRQRVFGREYQTDAEAIQLETFSGHADADEILRWMAAGSARAMTYLTNGEPEATDTLRRRVAHELGRRVRSPEHLETVRLDRPK